MSTAELPESTDTVVDEPNEKPESKLSAMSAPQIEFSLTGIIGTSLGLVLFIFVALGLLAQGFDYYDSADFMQDAPMLLMTGGLAFVSIVLLEIAKRSPHARATSRVIQVGSVAVWMTLMTIVVIMLCAVMNSSEPQNVIMDLGSRQG